MRHGADHGEVVADEEVAHAIALLQVGEQLNGKKVALIVCGSNLDEGRFSELVSRGQFLDAGAAQNSNVTY
jgi:threonine dehydratase